MSDTQVQPRRYLGLLALALILGLVSALITFAFIAFTDVLTDAVWQNGQEMLGVDSRLFTFAVCLLGGLLVGVLVRIFGDHNGIFADLMQEFGKTGRFDYRHAPGIVITAVISLVAGGSLGPEAPLADASGGIGTWVADRFKLNEQEMRATGFAGVSGMLAAFITEPFGGALLGLESAQGGAGGQKTYIWVLFPSLLASGAATVTFVLFSGAFFQTQYRFPEYSPRLVDLLYAIPLGLVGAFVGLLFKFLLRRLQALFVVMKDRLILRGLVGGLGMGIIGALFPLTLYSGEDQTTTLITHAAEIGVATLIVLGLIKLFATSLLLATGWKGGYVFPVMFASIALGMATNLLFPQIPVAVAVAATLSAALVATLRAPIFGALFTLVFVQHTTAAVIAIAVVISGVLALAVAARLAAQAQDTAEVR